MSSERGAFEPVLRRSLLLVAGCGLAGAIAMSRARLMDDPGAGWHLRGGRWIVVAGTAGLLALAAWRLDVFRDALAASFARSFPVVAAAYVRVAR